MKGKLLVASALPDPPDCSEAVQLYRAYVGASEGPIIQLLNDKTFDRA